MSLEIMSYKNKTDMKQQLSGGTNEYRLIFEFAIPNLIPIYIVYSIYNSNKRPPITT